MIEIVPIQFTSIQEIQNNFNFYKDKFVNDAVLVFRGANLTEEEHSNFHKFLGEKFGWTTFARENGDAAKYIEDHATNTNINTAQKDDIMLGWHIEHVYYENPILAATWNMIVFNTSSENGKTCFVDSEKLYKDLPEEWKNFLNSCVISSTTAGGNYNPQNHLKELKPIANHWISNNPVIRINISNSHQNVEKLISVNGNPPTEEEETMFKNIAMWFSGQVVNNEDIRLVHKWQKGDLVLTDMFKLAHAVTGGFDPADRKFIGIWGYKSPQ